MQSFKGIPGSEKRLSHRRERILIDPSRPRKTGKRSRHQYHSRGLLFSSSWFFHLLNVESHSTRASSLRIKRPIRNDAPKKGKGTGIQVIDPCIMKAFPSLFYNLHSSSEQTTLRKSAVIQCAVAGF